MSKYHNHDKRDANANAIVREVEAHGYEVIRIGQPLDILVVDRRSGWASMVELKVEGPKAAYLTTQLAFIAFTSIPVAFACNAAEVLRFVKTGNGLSQTQKNRLAVAIAAQPERKSWTPAMVREILGNYILDSLK